ncbi:MAG: glucose-1-phosphate adenylyltransferase subunit GlgD [Agathobacter sp.]|uniref:glucose-1-phosphate adenylyltransferase subunit GlgD n=1 Tax=Agathobacter sp. TaxID=2021311 RepID=UPI00259056AD|nr:glucose-1-phosphate adenylyltransferase subunit GlgD [Agathobacter sp.]MCR5677728.1 glucose-1-phosphate adenylyltransferase subunit GlgD [Agathobacter sp.]
MKAIGIILAGGSNHRMKELTRKRAIPAMPVGGSFRCIDFALSAMSNSHIQTVAVLTQYNARSLNEHLNSSKWWDFGRKQGGLYLFTPTVTADNQDWYRGTADSIYQNIDFLKKHHEPYVIISSGDLVYKMDFNKLLDYHIEKQADITVVCKDMPAQTDVSRFGVIRMNEEFRIVDFEEKPLQAHSNTISAGIYVFRRRQLIEMLERSAEENRYDLVQDIIVRYRDVKRVYGYKHKEYWANIADTQDYFKTNMEFLKQGIRNYFFREEPKTYSKIADLPPAKYNIGSKVTNSIVASGCIINGTVESSVLFKKAFVGKNCVIRNSIILDDVYIGDNSHIENCIVESKSTLRPNSYYCGEGEVQVVCEQFERYML